MQRLLASMPLVLTLVPGCFAEPPSVDEASTENTDDTSGSGPGTTTTATTESSGTSTPGTAEASSDPTDATADSTGGSTGEPPMCDAPLAGLVAWWAFEGNAQDAVTELPLTVTDASFSDDGRFGEALSFDGVDGIATAERAAPLDVGDGDFSIETWVYLESLEHPKASLSTLDDYAIVTRMVSLSLAPNSNGWRLLMFGGQTAPQWWFCMGGLNNGCNPDGASPNVATSASPPIAQTWTHLVGVRTGMELRLYVDGVLEGTAALDEAAPAINSDAAPLVVGATEFLPGERDSMLFGRVDDVSFYDRALDSGEVAQLADASQPRFR